MADEIKESIFEQRERALVRLGAADLAAVRGSLAERLNWEEAVDKPALAVVEAEATVPTYQQTSRWLGPLDYFWPRVTEVSETAKDGQIIIWRKHYFVLLGRTILPILAFLASTYLFIVSTFALGPFGFEFSAPFRVIFMLAMIASLLWWLWNYDGWRRDVYILTNTRITDIEASPFLIRGERRREGTFDNIQNITYDIPNFFAKLLNLGSVIIETAGTADTFTFAKIFNPSAVQQEVFNRMVLFQQRKREQDRDDTTNRLVQVIGEYHNLAERNTNIRPQQRV
jgi:hypothetical protein